MKTYYILYKYIIYCKFQIFFWFSHALAPSKHHVTQLLMAPYQSHNELFISNKNFCVGIEISIDAQLLYLQIVYCIYSLHDIIAVKCRMSTETLSHPQPSVKLMENQAGVSLSNKYFRSFKASRCIVQKGNSRSFQVNSVR